MDSKIALRIKAKDIRKSLDIINKSRIATESLRKQDYYKNAENVLLFYPLKYELNLLELLNDNKNFYLPKVLGKNLCICPFSLGDELRISEFNIKEPCSNPVSPENLDLVVVPALMVDKNKYRLGYGGGFYDRFLAAYPNLKTVVVIAQELFIDKLPREVFDVSADYILLV